MKASKLDGLTSNQYYGGLNRRFDRRSHRLRALGFKYVHVKEFGVAVFVRNRYGKVRSMTASAVMHASNRAYNEQLRGLVGW